MPAEEFAATDVQRNAACSSSVAALAFGLLIVTLVIAGSVWIMANLGANMMPPAELMDLHMQH